MRLIFLGAVLGLVTFLAFHVLFPSPVAPYRELQKALKDPDHHSSVLWALSTRTDGAGWIARVELARFLFAQGQPELGISLLREALAVREAWEARRLLAQMLEALGQPAEALREWKKLLPYGEAVEAVVRLDRDKISAGKALVAGRAYSQALELLAGQAGAEAALLRARALYGLGQYKEAAHEFSRYLEAYPGDREVRVEYGQALERAGQTDAASVAYKAAGAAGAYRLGSLLENLGRTEEALTAYRNSSEPEGRWRAALLLEKRGAFSQAADLYRELSQTSARVADDAALRLYLLSLRTGVQVEAAELKKLWPPAFFWLLGEEVPTPLCVPDPPLVIPLAVKIADELVRQFPQEGRSWAKIELEVALRNASAPETLSIGEWFARQGEWRHAFSLGTKVLAEIPCPRAYRLAYPLAWEELVRKWSAEYNVDPFLVWAVMREESSFSATAVSSSGARGLMQLLPSTARWVAEEKLKISYQDEYLFDPDYNIRLGTWYLRYLLDQFGGKVAWAIAAYHAGPGNVRRWGAEALRPPDLPGALRAPETREYLVKVLNAWVMYRWLYAGG